MVPESDVERVNDEQRFLQFCETVRLKALGFGVEVTRADIDYYIRWGPELWLHRFEPERARREGDEAQVAEALAKIRATLDLSTGLSAHHAD